MSAWRLDTPVPATPTDRFVSVRELRLHYRDWGGSGRPVVLIHGLASTCHIWDLVAPLLARNLAVVAVDQRGHGDSDKPDHGYDFATVAADLQGFVEVLGIDRPVIIGHSWGGNVALEHAVTYPAVPRGLGLIDGGTIEISGAAGMTLERAREQMAPPDFAGRTVEELTELARGRDWGFELTPEIERIVMANFEVLEDRTVRAKFHRVNHMAVIDAFWEHKPSSMYERVRCPVLLMPTRQVGEQLPADWQDSREKSVIGAGRLLPTSETVWLDDSVHDAPLHRSQLVADTIAGHFQAGFFDT